MLRWRLEHSRQYSVRSAYRLLQNQKGAWNAGDNIVFWKSLWNTEAPPKVLNLVCRAATYCLPTKVQLQTKHVQIDNVCPVCDEGVEFFFHALVQCKVAAMCWHIHNPGINTEGTREFPEWLESNLSGQSNKNKAKIITLCWSIWRSRNDLVWSMKR